ncbi:MAG: leucine--tRNA ligase [Pseudobdellovibrionaceae bacterium]
MGYHHKDIDSKWQKKWAEKQIFKADNGSQKPKYYALDMFPYPSGSGLHVGHIASYTPADIISRFKRAKGFNVLHPMGYDAFGLPAEQYAIQTGIHPAITTQKAIESFRKTLQGFGFSFDWTREISTCDGTYYKWTQFIFTKLFEKGLAYQKEVPVNWCPALKTVLANEEVVDGKSERGGHPVIRMPMKQWMLKITDYAERLLKDLDHVDWPERTKEGQRNWIGKSEGAHVRFQIEGQGELTVFTTRPDTLFGVTFMVLAPENPLVKKITTAEQKKAVEDYVSQASRKSEVERKAAQEKTGVFTGAFAINPLNQEKNPIWIADYVLMDYGTGAIMAVPAHDQRDFEFAKKFNLPIKQVLQSENPEDNLLKQAFEGEGILIQSDFINGLKKTEAIQKMLSHLEAKKIGTRQVQYKLRDWLFSRQRYWGEPFPIVHMSEGMQALPVNELPVLLPEVADYEPSESGEAPLAKVKDWVQYTSPLGKKGVRETDTMPGSAGSSWYFLRYTDPLNNQEAFSFEAQKYWMPVDIYIGGAEHTVGHLLYARFWQKVLFDCGLVSHDEPFKKLAHQGLVLGPDGEKMSKSRGNVVPADSAQADYGADATRMYICFMGPFEKDKPWSLTGIEGVRRFLDRTWRLVSDDEGKVIADSAEVPAEIEKLLHKTIKKVTTDIETMSFNTSISQMMILVNELYRLNIRPKSVLKILAQLMMPFAPHLAEEIWEKLGGEGFISLAPWPGFDPAKCADDVITMGVQVNGKMRGTVEIPPDATEAVALEAARAVASVQNAIGGKPIDKVIYKAGKILNLIVKA